MTWQDEFRRAAFCETSSVDQPATPLLTLDRLRAMMRSIPVVPPPVTICPSAFWPRDHIGDEVYSYRGHPFWQWLRRRFGVGYGLTMERGQRIYQDKPMVMNRETGAVYCSHPQARELKAAIARQSH